MEPQAAPPDNLPLLGNNRNALRGSIVQLLTSFSDNSKVYIFCKWVLSLLKILTMCLILGLTSTNTEEPLATFIYILVSVEAITALVSSYYLLSDPEHRSAAIKRAITATEYIAAL